MSQFEDKPLFDEHEDHVNRTTTSLMALESLHEVIRDISSCTPLQGALINQVLNNIQNDHPGLYLDAPSGAAGLTAVMEDIEAFSAKAASTIVISSKEVNQWIGKIVDHLEEDAKALEERLSKLGGELKSLDANVRPTGSFQYRSIMRNLCIGLKIDQSKIGVEADAFLTKMLQIRNSINSPQFNTMAGILESFVMTGDKEKDDAEIQRVFEHVENYLNTFLPRTRDGNFYSLEIGDGRKLRVDPRTYIGGKVIYSFVPSDISGGADTVTSGVLRTTIEKIDLKADIPYLSMRECADVLDHVASHIQRYKISTGFKETTARLTKAIEYFSRKHYGALRQRKRGVDPRAYVVMMNIASGFLYGLHIKALSQTSSVIGACLKYVEKSVSEAQKTKG